MALSEDAKQFLLEYDWPGNVRELQNLLEGIISTQNEPTITRQTIDRYLGYDRKAEISTGAPPAPGSDFTEIELEEKGAIMNALRLHNNNRTLAAEHLSMPRRTFYRRLEKYKIS